MNIRIQQILQNKISEIQSRVPIPVKKAGNALSFENMLRNNADITNNRSVSLNTEKRLYPLVSGSYEAEYPRLSSDEIAALMPQINSAIETASKKYNVEENMIRSIIKQESSFQPLALSTSGAMGLMQLMPDTARWLSVENPYDIEENIMGGTQYYRDQLNAFDGNTTLALAAYNAGPNNVIKYNGIPPFTQTQNYVKNILEYYQLYVSSQG